MEALEALRTKWGTMGASIILRRIAEELTGDRQALLLELADDLEEALGIEKI